jgi:hypothetical protein
VEESNPTGSSPVHGFQDRSPTIQRHLPQMKNPPFLEGAYMNLLGVYIHASDAAGAVGVDDVLVVNFIGETIAVAKITVNGKLSVIPSRPPFAATAPRQVGCTLDSIRLFRSGNRAFHQTLYRPVTPAKGLHG